jgi:hypothetical protein
MWPWIKRWQDWAVTDLWPLTHPGVTAQAMHHSYEKGGLVIDNQSIPWNADAVLVECNARLPAVALRRKEDFLLRMPGSDPVPLDNIRRDETTESFRLYFRLPPPAQNTNAEVVWRHHRLGELTLTVVPRSEFLEHLRLQHATLAVSLGNQTVACQTFVSSQCRGLFAGAVLSNKTSLAPIVDLDCHIDWRREGDADGKQYPVQLSSSQLKSKQALLTVCPSHLPRKTGTYVASWKIDDQVLATQRVKVISKSQFRRSLRISETRFVVQLEKGDVRLTRQMPSLAGVARIGPCFLVSSSEVGMAGRCTLCVSVQLPSGLSPAKPLEQELLLTDGPAPFAPGTLNVDDMKGITAFELRTAGRSLGILPLTAAPVAAFNGEGGFKPPPEYVWSSAAEDQLQERLAKLLATGDKR